MTKLIDDGADGPMTDYPDRLRTVLAGKGLRTSSTHPENTLPAFARSLAHPAISTLELDTGVTQDGQLVVPHDRAVNGSHCADDPAVMRRVIDVGVDGISSDDPDRLIKMAIRNGLR
ncbi:glycerophosphodiester phosphodiesterase family protein [Actinoplanes sp. NPDC048988]|uniref:glycerophosphodiester phosphodiesterase family protein n=1 Tax=Actinoplanes sp. NPDC048988 TaxID=3363901 RepID=UPI0037159328